MPSVKFDYNLEEDIKNIIWHINNLSFLGSNNPNKQYGQISLDVVQQIKLEKDQEAQKNIIREYLNKINDNEFIKQKIEKFQNDWNKINDEYFKRLEKILSSVLPPETEFIAFLTNAGGCMFDARFRTFKVRLHDETTDATAAHEIIHIGFIRKYWRYCSEELKLTPQQFGNFQEASTVLLNEEMSDILSRPDYGYKEHKELREKLLEQWRKDKNFKNLLDYYSSLVTAK